MVSTTVLLLNFFIAFGVSCATMPLVVILSKRIGAFSEVGGRHVGERSIGRLGGIGVLVAFLFAVMSQIVFDADSFNEFEKHQKQLYGVSIGLLIISTVGFWDDVNRLPASAKLLAQCLAAMLGYFFDLRISAVDLPLLEPIQLGWLAFPVTVIWVVGIVNAINLIDGLDGLAGGVLLFASIVNATVAFVSGSSVLAAITVATCGSTLGFLMHNWHPAKIFLGDGGAYAFGYLIAVCGLWAPTHKASTGVSLLVPILATGLPVFDTLYAMARRLYNGKNLFVADRGHLHHILLDSGISHKRVVVGLYFISCLLASVAIAIVLKRNRSIGYMLVIASLLGGFFWCTLVKRQLKMVATKYFSWQFKYNKK
jgi:UDP-GlcNAc:undecaprenyl-phosphate GlcNAc-1-phosphate transferase